MRSSASARPSDLSEVQQQPPLPSSVRLSGGGVLEELNDPGVRLVPMGRWVVPSFMVIVLVAGISVIAATAWPWLRPVQLEVQDLRRLYRPALVVDGQSWAEPGVLERDWVRPGFCDGLLTKTLQPSTRAVAVTDRGELVGSAFTAAYAAPADAKATFNALTTGLNGCRTRGGRWLPDPPRPTTGAVHSAAYRLEPGAGRTRRPPHVVVLQYANTVALFMTGTRPDIDAIAEAYRIRVAAVARTAPRDR